jgi:hypothetical protein
MRILAEANAGTLFDFSGFQQAFHDTWDFIFPNALMLCLCVWIARYVGRITLPWLRVPWDRLRDGLQQITKFLSDANLFGSKLVPAVVILCVAIATLDVFQVVRLAAENILPPTIVTMPAELYSRLASRELSLKIFAGDQSIHRQYEIYERIASRSQEFERDAKAENPNTYWSVVAGKWWTYAGDLKLLALVALVSCIAGLMQGHRRSTLRLIVVLIPLAIGFMFCLAKHLYGREQQAFVVLRVLESDLRDTPIESPPDILRKRAAAMGDDKFLLALGDNHERSWWELRWFDTDFFRRGADLFGVSTKYWHPHRQPVWTEKDLRDAGISRTGMAADDTPKASPYP